MNEPKQRGHNAMVGLAIGDAQSWPAMYHRSFLLPPWTRRILREMNEASETEHVIITPTPFSLNQPARFFDIGPTDDTEWAAFTAQILLQCGPDLFSEAVLKEWKALAESTVRIRGGVSIQAALQNLRNGILPPHTGSENPHYFDDGAAVRAVPIGVMYAGDPSEAARLASMDASMTNSEDGIWAAQAMAAAISMACSGRSIHEAIVKARSFLPESSWIARTVNVALALTEGVNSIHSIFPELHDKVLNRTYSYGNIAPETIALTFAIARVHGDDFERALTIASSFAKSGDTLPALVGALAGALQPVEIASEKWLHAISTLNGICIPSLAGKNYLAIVDRIAESASHHIDTSQ